MKTFLQDPPHIGNQYLEDTTLVNLAHILFPKELLCQHIEKDLKQFGDKVATSIKQLGDDVENNLPKVLHFDAWQNRIDKIETHPSWQKLHDVSAEEGIVAIAYNRKQFGRFARVYQLFKLYMFDTSAGLYTCPLAMTDGAARLLEVAGGATYRKYFEHLTSRDPAQFWTSGQWMTEKTGGSDVSRTETLAHKVEASQYSLHGFKWFTSATDANMTLGLAKVVEPGCMKAPEKAPLSLFLIPIRDFDTGKLNGIKVHKLKNKLGTKAVPTAELALKNTKAFLVGPEGRGVSTISYMLNITRIYNAIGAVSHMRRIVALVQDYTKRRRVAGVLLSEKPLHLHSVAKIVAEYQGSLLFVMRIGELLGKNENGDATEIENDLLRLLIPIAKLYTGKKAVSVVSEGMELIGGMAYMEDTNIPKLLRNAQVLPIWEGTTNVLSLDLLRVLSKTPKAFEHWCTHITQIVSQSKTRLSKLPATSSLQQPELKSILENAFSLISSGLKQVQQYVVKSIASKKMELIEAGSRELAFSIAHVQISAYLLQHVLDVHDLHSNANYNIEKEVYSLHQYILDHSPLTPLANYIFDTPSSGDFVLRLEKMLAMDVGGYDGKLKSKY